MTEFCFFPRITRWRLPLSEFLIATLSLSVLVSSTLSLKEVQSTSDIITEFSTFQFPRSYIFWRLVALFLFSQIKLRADPVTNLISLPQRFLFRLLIWFLISLLILVYFLNVSGCLVEYSVLSLVHYKHILSYRPKTPPGKSSLWPCNIHLSIFSCFICQSCSAIGAYLQQSMGERHGSIWTSCQPIAGQHWHTTIHTHTHM